MAALARPSDPLGVLFLGAEARTARRGYTPATQHPKVPGQRFFRREIAGFFLRAVANGRTAVCAAFDLLREASLEPHLSVASARISQPPCQSTRSQWSGASVGAAPGHRARVPSRSP